MDSIFTKTGLKGMLEGNDYKALDSSFSLMATFIDRCTGNGERALLKRVHTIHSNIIC